MATIYRVVNQRSGKTKVTTTSEEEAKKALRKLGVYTHYIETDRAKNPPKPAKGKFIPCKAVRFNANGSVSIKK